MDLTTRQAQPQTPRMAEAAPQDWSAVESERRRADAAERLAAILSQIGAADHLDTALRILACGALALLNGQGGAVRVYGLSEGTGSLAFWVTADGELEPADYPETLPGTVAGDLRAGGPMRIIDDLWDLDPEIEATEKYVRRRGMRSSVAVPITVQGKRIGSLHVDHREVGHFGPADLSTAAALATMAGAAIDRLRLQAAERDHLAANQALRRLATERDQALMRAEAALAERDQALAEAQEALTLRDQFISLASHELRTPITSLRGYAQLLLRQYRRHGNVSPEQVQRALHLIDQQSEKLSRLAMQLVDTSRIESGELRLDCRSTDLGQLLEDIVSSAQTMLEINAPVMQVRHSLTLHLGVQVTLNLDRTRIEHVIVNLIDNAIRYSPNGGEIAVSLESHQVSQNHNSLDATNGSAQEVRIAVRDHGIGIPERFLERVFDRFFQVQRHGNPGGMGLGLYVSRQIVAKHGGRIWAESPGGGGTRFVIALPLVPLDASAPVEGGHAAPDTDSEAEFSVR